MVWIYGFKRNLIVSMQYKLVKCNFRGSVGLTLPSKHNYLYFWVDCNKMLQSIHKYIMGS